MTKLRPSILRAKLPVNGCTDLVTLPFKGLNLLSECGFISYSAVKTHPTEYAQLYLRHVKPTAMLGGVVELQPLGNSPSLGRLEGLVQRSDPVGVEVIQHHPDHFSFRIGLIHKPSHLIGKVLHGAMLRHCYVSPAPLGLKEHKQVPGAASLVLVVISLRSAWLGWQAHSLLCHQLFIGLVKAYLGALGVVRLLIQVQHFLHGGHELRAYRWNAPLLFLPRPQFCFFKTWRTVSGEIESAKPNSTTFPASRRKVQRAWPWGGSLQATAMRWACCLPLSLMPFPGRGRSLRALWRPSSTKRLRTRPTVALPVFRALATSWSVSSSWALSKIRARVSLRAEEFPFRMSWSNCSRSSSVKSTMYLIAGMSGTSFFGNYVHSIPVIRLYQNHLD